MLPEEHYEYAQWLGLMLGSRRRFQSSNHLDVTQALFTTFFFLCLALLQHGTRPILCYSVNQIDGASYLLELILGSPGEQGEDAQ